MTSFQNKKFFPKLIYVVMSAVILLSMPVIMASCVSSSGDNATNPFEPAGPPAKGQVTLEVLNADGTPCPNVLILYTDLPHEVTITLGSTDANGRYVWEEADADRQSLIVQYGNDRIAVFEGEITETDFENTIILKASGENKIDGRITPTYAFSRAD